MDTTKGNMYEFAVTWNPLGGECQHKCAYCSTNNLRKRFKHLDEKYSGKPMLYYPKLPKSDKLIFVCAQNDLFVPNVPSIYIESILQACSERMALIQTKNPKRVLDFLDYLSGNAIVCTTIETNRIYPQMGNTPSPQMRAYAMRDLSDEKVTTQVTIEPIMDFDLEELVLLVKMCNPVQVNIGADSKRNNLPEPRKEKVIRLISELEKFTVVHQKKNLKRLLK